MKVLPTLITGFVDPLMTCASNFQYPKNWAMDSIELEEGKTIKEKEKIREDMISKEGLKVAVQIAICLKNLQNNELICLPYCFE